MEPKLIIIILQHKMRQMDILEPDSFSPKIVFRKLLTFGSWERDISDCGTARSILSARAVNLLLEQEYGSGREVKGRQEKRQEGEDHSIVTQL